MIGSAKAKTSGDLNSERAKLVTTAQEHTARWIDADWAREAIYHLSTYLEYTDMGKTNGEAVRRLLHSPAVCIEMICVRCGKEGWIPRHYVLDSDPASLGGAAMYRYLGVDWYWDIGPGEENIRSCPDCYFIVRDDLPYWARQLRQRGEAIHRAEPS